LFYHCNKIEQTPAKTARMSARMTTQVLSCLRGSDDCFDTLTNQGVQLSQTLKTNFAFERTKSGDSGMQFSAVGQNKGFHRQTS
jgi:hypothetical protein